MVSLYAIKLFTEVYRILRRVVFFFFWGGGGGRLGVGGCCRLERVPMADRGRATPEKFENADCDVRYLDCVFILIFKKIMFLPLQ